jgi:hypothetical protein
VAQQEEHAEILRQFFAGEYNSVGDYWHKDTIQMIVEWQQATIADHARIVAELEAELGRRTSEVIVVRSTALACSPAVKKMFDMLREKAEALEASLAACHTSVLAWWEEEKNEYDEDMVPEFVKLVLSHD